MQRGSIPTLPVRVTWPFRSASKELELDADAAWAAQGITPEQLADPDTRIPVSVSQDKARWVVELTRCSDYGLRAAELAEPGLFDLAEYAARSQPTVRRALERTARLTPLIVDGDLEIEAHAEAAWIPARGRTAIYPVSMEFTLAYLHLTARRFTGLPELCPTEVHFTHAAPPDISRHERLFQAPLRFGASEDRLVYPASLLDLPLAHADSRLSALLDRVAGVFRAAVPERSAFSSRVRQLVARHLPHDGAPVTEIARELALTPDTLHRRLEAEGTTYRELADDVRRGLALGYLDQRDLSLSEIAFLLGFSGGQGFHRAFKRWTGKTPAQYRREK